ncbi:hypothetical protein NLJ89_g7746 [Agrocybe chaxingu]|uniref:F-box domain-containing protein n=1 Tax=Agrocybe chaxingu TaxID=84603 RepID=A0A9W8JTZ5_9AGAR|nr:hypothetical protein NLJ89_g7746 [Agrocybe chaxingu]
MTALKETPQRKAFPGGVYRDKPCELEMQDHHMCAGGWEPQSRQPKRAMVFSFSYHLHRASAVCRQWRDIIRTLPEYWSRVVIFLDLDEPLEDIEARIARSKGLPLDVRVIRSNWDDDVSDSSSGEDEESSQIKQEQSRAREIMKILAPLVPRCRSFVFDTKYSSSLPFISQYFRGTAPHLRVLKLQCQTERRNVECPEIPTIKPEDEFTFPRLTTIVLDGCTFMDACRVPSWTRQVKSLYLDTLSISLLSVPDSHDDQFDMYKFADYLAKIGYIRHLSLAHIEIAYDPGTEDEGYHQYKVDNLTIENQDQPWLEEFNLITFGSSLCYYHLLDSSIAYESMTMAHHLRLERITDFGYVFDRAIARHFGNRLDLVDCEGLKDHHLDVIARKCQLLRRLYLLDCPNITVQGLKNMITAREDVAGAYDEDRVIGDRDTSDETGSVVELTDEDDTELADGYVDSGGANFTPIHRLHVQGHPHKLTKSERLWFKRRLEFFSWD